jgi:hypothetical protein
LLVLSSDEVDPDLADRETADGREQHQQFASLLSRERVGNQFTLAAEFAEPLQGREVIFACEPELDAYAKPARTGHG